MHLGQEFKALMKALVERLSNYESHIWQIALSKEITYPRVNLHVNMALVATQYSICNYFGGVLERIAGCIGLSARIEDNPACSV